MNLDISSFTNNFKNKKALYTEVFSTPAGKEVLKDLIQFTHVYNPTYVQGDASASAHNEGMRRVGLRIMSFLNKEVAQQTEQAIYRGEQHGK